MVTSVLCVNETYEEKKLELLRQIKVCRELMQACSDYMKRSNDSEGVEAASQIKDNQVAVMNDFLSDLMELERWNLPSVK